VEEDGRPPEPGHGSGSPRWADRPLDEPIAWDQDVEPAAPVSLATDPGPGDPTTELATLAALADPATRSPRPETCPFFRTIDASGAPAPPVEAVDGSNRCVAVGPPRPQSARQQQLVCLTAGHSNCPRYLRGSIVAAEALAPPKDRGPSTVVVAAALALVAAAAMSVGFLLVRGSFEMPGAPGGSQLAAATLPPTIDPSPAAPSPSAPEPTPVVTPSATPMATPAPAVTPSPATPTPAVTPAPSPVPSSNRYALLVPCPGTPDCWIYTVRAGDNFQSIVNYFGVPYATVVRMNPGLGDPTTIHAGDRIRMPPPTR
jgi:hypothetical protein